MSNDSYSNEVPSGKGKGGGKGGGAGKGGAQHLVAKPNCRDYSETFQGENASFHGTSNACWYHLEWAMREGLTLHPDWYPAGTTNSSADVQCALYLKSMDFDSGTGHACKLPPCAAITKSMLEGKDPGIEGNVTKCLVAETTTTTSTIMRSEVIEPPAVVEVVTTTTEAPGPSVEWWGWLLIALAVLGCIGAVAAFLLHGKKKAPAKKRAIQKAATQPAPAPAPQPIATASVSMPVAMPVYQYAPMMNSVVQAPAVYAAPTAVTEVMMAPPVYAAPAMSTVAQPVYAAPAMSTVAQPMAYYAQPNAASAAFGALDANHDGVISRAEFAGAFGR